ncbi:serine/threonine-protein kinase [Kytococcus sedentarius]|uniref:serine/threonine-protein kinase n=1 Tax=Kytococcus sedentarius TaxID=1276 RepID=UPI00194F6F15|nr:serine/threonine-protein kinase [Kytococcus sedentarius]QRO86465.1 serine/threonine protein kinase [Kytococcus sedentarius]
MTERIGRYELQGVIGTGSFATVHCAHDPVLHGTVVLKVLAENHSLNPEVRERFIAEGRALRKVRSPHVVTVHDLGETDRQQPYLVLEHADRGTLAERVAAVRGRGGRPTTPDLLTVAEQLSAALGALHDRRLVHRDLSPANVLITSVGTESGEPARLGGPEHGLLAPDEQLLLADLGLCKDLALNSGLTVAGGTRGFRPPEMRGGPAVVDQRADLWSLSTLLAWLARGSGAEDALAPVLERGSAERPEDRQPTAERWFDEFRSTLADDPPPAVEQADAPPAAPLRRALVPGAVAASLLAGGLVGWALAPDGQPPASSDAGRVEIVGPERLTVGEKARFRADRKGVEHFVWELPDGRFVADSPRVSVTPSSAGTATVVLRGRDTEGRLLSDELRVRVRD